MIIDTHAHFTPQSVLTALKANLDKFPNVELLEEDGKFRLAFMGQAPTRPLSPTILSWIACWSAFMSSRPKAGILVMPVAPSPTQPCIGTIYAYTALSCRHLRNSAFS